MKIPSYERLRKAIERRDRGLREKVCSLEEAVGLIPEGAHVAVGGCHYSRTPMALLWEIIRQRKTGLTFSRSITSTEGDLLLAGGVTRHIITSWFSAGVTWGVSRVMREFVQSGQARYEEWSHLSIGLRYRAGGMGVPFLPARSMMGSGVAERLPGLKTLTCPYTGEPLALIPALNPDVALIHVHRADPFGNAQIDGLPFMDADIALAANQVILSAERIVHPEQIRRAPDRTFLSFLCVEAVVEAPFGSMPHECYGLYEPAFGHIEEYVKRIASAGTEGARAYLEEWCHGLQSWEDFLARLGAKTLLEAARAGSEVNNA
ncbi:MAG: CoA transferase subunit A [Candidatus Tectomicrobia bacterium]|nr:CoA transferase subunit A [Candidatus Tectomicrobia bacterium]